MTASFSVNIRNYSTGILKVTTKTKLCQAVTSNNTKSKFLNVHVSKRILYYFGNKRGISHMCMLTAITFYGKVEHKKT